MKKIKNISIFTAIFSLAVFSLTFTLISSAEETFPQRVSVASDGTEGNGHSGIPVLSENGRYVLFNSTSSNLISDDANSSQDVFVHDRDTGITERVSVASDGTEGNGHSNARVITPDGRYVVFNSASTNLVSSDTNNEFDIFIYDRLISTTERVSVAFDGSEANGESISARISNDGRYVAFSSDATNLVPGDTNNARDTFVHDRQTGTTERVSVASDGGEGNNGSFGSLISGNGRYVAFSSEATNLIPNDTNCCPGLNANTDVFVHDRDTGITERVSVASDGSEANHRSTASDISLDGRYVVFSSDATNLVPGDTNNVRDTFVHDRQTGTTERVSVASDGGEGNFNSSSGSISDDGRYVAFQSQASSLVSEDMSGTSFDVFIHDRQTDATKRVSVTSGGDESDGTSLSPDISIDGRYVGFISDATNLVSNDMNNRIDVYITQNPFIFAANEAPILNLIGDKTVNEGELLEFTVTATDPDGDNLTFTAANLPNGATFDSNTATFSWTPAFGQAGNYTDVEFTVMDDGSPMELDVELITITVGAVNRPPVFDAFDTTYEVDEDVLLTFTVSATDPDGDNITLSATSLPTGAAFNASTGVFEWTPDNTQGGIYIVTFTATDDGTPTIESADIDVTITVNDVPTPVEQAEDLVEEVILEDFPTNIENSYLANLKKVEKFIEEGKIQAAINQLEAFIGKVEQDLQSGEIDQATADYLIGLANNLIADLQG